MSAVEVKVTAVKGNAARGAVSEVMGSARKIVRAASQMVPSAEVTEVIWTREVTASNAGRKGMLCGHAGGYTRWSAPNVRGAKVALAEVGSAEMTTSADMWGAYKMSASADMCATADVTSNVAAATMAGAVVSSVVLLRHGRRGGDEGECGNSAKPEFSYVTHGSPPQSPPTCN